MLRKRIASIMLCLAMLSCLMSGCQGDAPDLSDDTWGNSVGNILENGSVAYSDGVFYYNNSEPGRNGLYCFTENSGHVKLSEKNAYNINVVDGQVYFLDGLPGHICSISTSGQDLKILVRERAKDLFVSSTAMLYRKGDRVCMSNLSGQHTQIIAENVLSFLPHNGKIFFARYRTEADGLYQVNPDGSELVCLSEEIPDGLCSNGQDFYYSVSNDKNSSGKAGGRVYRIDQDGEIIQLPIADDCWNMNATEEYIFYRNQTACGALYRMDLDGNNAVCLTPGNCVYIQVLGDLVVFYSPTTADGLPSGYHSIKIDGSELQ